MASRVFRSRPTGLDVIVPGAPREGELDEALKLLGGDDCPHDRKRVGVAWHRF